jgi:hypothetical protein
MGWGFFSFGMLFVLFFSRDLDFSDITRFRGQLSRTPGTVLLGEETELAEDEEPVYEMAFAFQPEGSEREFRRQIRTLEPERLEDEPGEPLLYLPSDPNQAVLLDSRPGGVEITRKRQLQGTLLRALMDLWLPLLSLLLLVLTLRNLLV